MNFSFYKAMNKTVGEEAVVVDCGGLVLENNISSTENFPLTAD